MASLATYGLAMPNQGMDNWQQAPPADPGPPPQVDAYGYFVRPYHTGVFDEFANIFCLVHHSGGAA